MGHLVLCMVLGDWWCLILLYHFSLYLYSFMVWYFIIFYLSLMQCCPSGLQFTVFYANAFLTICIAASHTLMLLLQKKIQKKLLNSFYSIIMQHIVRNTIVQCQPCIFFSSLHFYFQILYRHEIIPHWLQHFCFFICSFFRILDLMSKDSQEILLTILLYYPWVFEPIFIGFWLVSSYHYYAMIGPYLIQYLAKKQHLH